MNTSRRHFLAAASAALPIGVLVACAGTTPSQVATDVDLIASGVASVVTVLQQDKTIPAASLAQIQGYLTTIQADAGKVAAATATPVAGTVQEIAQAVQAVAPIALAFLPGGSALVPVVNAAVSLLPAVLAAVGVASASAVKPAYEPAAARLILRDAATR